MPAPSSSNSTMEFSSATLRISIILVMCAENVLRLCSIDCSSPMSAYTERYGGIRDEESASTGSPLIIIVTARPTVLRATVFPPVFGPVITTTFVSSVIWKSMGTTFSDSIRGWTRWTSLILLAPPAGIKNTPLDFFA